MVGIARLLLLQILACLKSRAELRAENLMLRLQVEMLQLGGLHHRYERRAA
jgi:hypothetical protein